MLHSVQIEINMKSTLSFSTQTFSVPSSMFFGLKPLVRFCWVQFWHSLLLTQLQHSGCGDGEDRFHPLSPSTRSSKHHLLHSHFFMLLQGSRPSSENWIPCAVTPGWNRSEKSGKMQLFLLAKHKSGEEQPRLSLAQISSGTSALHETEGWKGVKFLPLYA